MKLAVISFTVNGTKRNLELLKSQFDEIEVHSYFKSSQPEVQREAKKDLRCTALSESVAEWTKFVFSWADAILFIGAAGIAVRAIAPLIQDKFYDPAVLVMDEQGIYCIPLLAGHVGGANELTWKIRQVIGCQPVITTATDVNHRFAVDVFAKKNGLCMEDRILAKDISAALLAEEPVGFFSDFPWTGELPDGLKAGQLCHRNIHITSSNDFEEEKTLKLVPPTIVVGVGCRKHTQADRIQSAIWQTFQELKLHPLSGAAIATIDLKKEEEGLKETAEILQIPMICYSAEELAQVHGEFAESEFVKNITGIGNVCERAALKAAEAAGGYLVCKKKIWDGVTTAAACIPWKGTIKF